jgi:hypothetical protein
MWLECRHLWPVHRSIRWRGLLSSFGRVLLPLLTQRNPSPIASNNPDLSAFAHCQHPLQELPQHVLYWHQWHMVLTERPTADGRRRIDTDDSRPTFPDVGPDRFRQAQPVNRYHFGKRLHDRWLDSNNVRLAMMINLFHHICCWFCKHSLHLRLPKLRLSNSCSHRPTVRT